MTICIIPARGGSKRIPRKNINSFHGKPMIQWSIEAAQTSKIFKHIIVSTEDDEIREIAESLGALVPFKRPSWLADDYTNTIDVIAHACEWCKKSGVSFDVACCLYATAPFVKSFDLIKAFDLLSEEKWQYVFSAGEYSAPILRSFRKNENGGVEMFFPQYFSTRSQDLPPAYFDAGMFYMGKADAWLNKLKFFEKHSFALTLPSCRIQDIDTPEDWVKAEKMAHNILIS